MSKKSIMMIADYTEDSVLSFDELCDICQLSEDSMNEFILYEVIHPIASLHEKWIFDLEQLKRVQTALRLQRDLGVNLQGAALVLDLLDEINRLREKEALLEKHYHIKI